MNSLFVGGVLFCVLAIVGLLIIFFIISFFLPSSRGSSMLQGHTHRAAVVALKAQGAASADIFAKNSCKILVSNSPSANSRPAKADIMTAPTQALSYFLEKP